MGKGFRASMPSSAVPFSPNLHVFTNPEALRTLSFWDFMEASLHRHDLINSLAIDNQFSLHLLSPPPEVMAVGLKVPTL